MKKLALPVLLSAFIVGQLAFVLWYVSAEHTFHFWDMAMYHSMARQLWQTTGQDFSAGLALFRSSFSNDYNLLFALPSLLSFSVFGDSRAVFIGTNFLFFFVPYELAVGFVLRRVFSLPWGRSLVLGFLTSSLIPFLWMPLLAGFPDHAASVFLCCAIGVSLNKELSWRRALLFGALLGLTVLLRRHYAYAVLALLVTSSLFSFIFSVLKVPSPQRSFWRFCLFYGLSGLVAGGLVFFAAPEFFMRALLTNYATHYAAYKASVSSFLVFTFGSLGFLLSGLSFIGFALAFRFPSSRKALAFIGGTTFLWFLIWCLWPTQEGVHHILPLLPPFISVGLSGLFLTCWALRWEYVYEAVLLLLLGTNSAWSLAFATESVVPDGSRAPHLFSAPRPPEIRKDFDALVGLASYLAAKTTSTDKILTVGSSFTFNQDLLRAVFTDQLHNEAFYSRFLWATEIDGVQKPPFDTMASANIYVVADPAQYHLAPEGQKVVTSLVRQFPPAPEFSAYFHADKKVFRLGDGSVVVRIWRREKWTPAALQNSFKFIASTTGSSQKWVSLKAPQVLVSEEGPQETQAVFHSTSPYASEALFYNEPLSEAAYRLHFHVAAQQSCPKLNFRLTAQTSEGTVLWSKVFSPVLVPGFVSHSFRVSPNQERNLFLRLGVDATGSVSCGVLLQRLRVERFIN